MNQDSTPAPRFLAQEALAHYLSLTQIVSECESEDQLFGRKAYVAESMFHTHLFNNMTENESRTLFMKMREAQIEANENERLDEENTFQAKILAETGYSITAIAAMLDYMIFYDELDEVRQSYIEIICREANLSSSEIINSISPVFRALYKKWSD